MNTTTPRPTPETDALAVVCYGEGGIEASHGFRAVPIKDCRKLERERDEAREELQQWKMLCAWGGTPEHIDQFIKGQQSRIHQAQDIEETCEQLERERDEALAKLSTVYRWIERNHSDGFIDSQSHLQNLDRVADAWHDKLEDMQRELGKTRDQLEAMREAIREAGHILGYYRKFTPALVDLPEDIWLETVEGKQVLSALTKLKLFIKP